MAATTGHDFITLGADVGGEDADNATQQHVLGLRRLLRQKCSKIASEGLKEIALVLRIDGSVQAWKKSGAENIFFWKKRAYATADIFVPIEVWSNGDASGIRRFLLEEVMSAIRLVVERVNRKGVALEMKAFERALANVKRQYLG